MTTANEVKIEQPYGPGAMCEHCGHFACRHDMDGCSFERAWRGGSENDVCDCKAMLWFGVCWPHPWLPAPEGLRYA